MTFKLLDDIGAVIVRDRESCSERVRRYPEAQGVGVDRPVRAPRHPGVPVGAGSDGIA